MDLPAHLYHTTVICKANGYGGPYQKPCEICQDNVRLDVVVMVYIVIANLRWYCTALLKIQS